MSAKAAGFFQCTANLFGYKEKIENPKIVSTMPLRFGRSRGKCGHRECSDGIGSRRDRLGVKGAKEYIIDPIAYELTHNPALKSLSFPKVKKRKEPRRVVKRMFVEQTPANSGDEDLMEEEEIELAKKEAEVTEARRQAMLEAQPLKYESTWLKIIEFLMYMRDEKRIEKARRVWRPQDQG